MPEVIAYFGKHKEVSRYDTVYDAMHKGDIEMRCNGADRVEVYDRCGDLVAWKEASE